MALQVTKTNDNGLTLSYWRVDEIKLDYTDTWPHQPSGQLFAVNVKGYHDAEYRAKEAGVETHQYIITGEHLTNILNGTAGDLRPGIYNWLKSGSIAWETGSDYGRQGGTSLDHNFFTGAANV